MLQRKQAVKPLALDFRVDLLLLCCGRALSGGIDKREQHIKAHRAQNIHGVLKVGVRFSGETYDNIRGKCRIGHLLADVAHDVEVSRLIVVAVHGFEYAIAARLQGQVELMRDMLRACHDVDQLIACVLGVAGHKAQHVFALNLVKL